MKLDQRYPDQAAMLKVLAHPARLAILEVLRDEEHCVCHFQAVLKKRQAYISQQLIVLKDAGLINCRREGLNKYYQLTDPSIINILDSVHTYMDFSAKSSLHHPRLSCLCPKCNNQELAIT